MHSTWCHLDRLRRSLRPEEEWRDREDVSLPMLMQGVLTKLLGCYPRHLHMRDGVYYKFWVYILSSRSGTLYVGITGYLNRRITQHKIDTIEGFTRSIIAIVWSITRVTRMYGWPLHVRNSSSAG